MPRPKGVEGNRDERAVLEEYLAKEVLKTIGDKSYTKEKPYMVEMSRGLKTAPNLKECLVIYYEDPQTIMLTTGSRFAPHSEIEGYQLKLIFDDGRWKFSDNRLDYYNRAFPIFAFLRKANEVNKSGK